MTNVFSAYATANFIVNTDSLAVEITAPANTTIKIKKIRISHADGDETVTSDYYRKVQLVRESVAGTGGSTFTPIDLDDNNNASVSTVKTGAFTPGTVSDTVDVLSIHSVTDFYWSAADDDDKIVILPGGIFGIILNPAN
jgi:hypothetical protein